MTNACASLLSGGDPGYFRGAMAQLIALQAFMPKVDHVLMVEQGAYSKIGIANLARLGWTIKSVPPIRTLGTKYNAERWPRTFTKLNLWNLTEYDRVVYIDADACPFAPFNELFNLKIKPLAATRAKADYEKRFRSGMMVMSPDADVFAELLELTQADPSKNGSRCGDQGILNLHFGGVFTRLQEKYNRCDWSKKSSPTVIGHLRPTPWSKRTGSPAMRPYVSRWHQFYKTARAKI